jgi:hypothetical protein
VEWLAGGERERGRELKAAAAMAGGTAGMARGGGEGWGLNRPARLWVTADDGGEASSCYGGSTTEHTAGTADGPGVRHAHGVVRRRGRRGSRRLCDTPGF